jgi:periplasmic protein TonB
MNTQKSIATLSIIFFFFMIECALIAKPNSPGSNLAQDDAYAAYAEVMPEPIGGITAVFKRIVYPEIAKRTNIEGKVYLLIYVNENGGVDDVKVIKSLGGGCDEAAVKAVKESKFSAGKNNGAPLKVKLSMAITFKLK